ncbi:hypothetical protein CVT25_007382 [Psilocybe cyanescens]|uniref:Uncharacterized protein n=1 Tax=Psilocybe cyanescens TaxID=93625 RepID=A0A409XJA9_PSICY|nr:hypothetical protein CVT25_007382 [Psilocybe cyanescens]
MTSIGGGDGSSIDPSAGFIVANYTAQNVYLRTPTGYLKILPNENTPAQTQAFDYVVRNNDTDNSAVFLTISVKEATNKTPGGVSVGYGALKGKIEVTISFA